MRRFVVSLLLIACAGAANAWAVDFCDEALSGSHAAAEQAPGDSHDADHPCHHCGHFSAHVLGLLPPPGDGLVPAGTRHDAVGPLALLTPAPTPPFHPPDIL